ncbi:MAG: hypothetical protein M1436_01725 [Acidobacteria bacterium]|nr:hypothetical protein [Acidobacteriota bacterium]
MIPIGDQGTLEPDGDRIIIRPRSGGTPEIIDATDREGNAVAKAGAAGEVGKTAIKISLLAEMSLREKRVVTWNDLPA